MATRDAAARELSLLDEGEAGLEKAGQALVEAEESLRGAGERLAAVRHEASESFTTQLAAAAADLALPNASFSIAFTPMPFESWNAEGSERIEFLFAAGSGESPRPLARIASGGEISRVMLALKGVLGAADAVPVLVFDEVDAGIGGATALSVGRRLALLARDHQVLVVTHLPQVAAHADAHVVVEKHESEGRTVTAASRVDGDAIVVEIARMLAGGASETGLAHARELLASAADAAKG
jgi:DNA repair protein RecN (Recombination protein N)